MHRSFSLLALAGLVACSNDYLLQYEVVAEPEVTGTLAETEPAAPPAEEDPVDPVDPTEPQPAEEEAPPEGDCDHTEDEVYVIDRNDDALYLFDPTTQSFSFVGDLACGGAVGTPQSMAVSRDGFAYVRYSDDQIHAVDLETMACTPTPFTSPLGSFGMGFAMNDGSEWQDTLYIANDRGLATLDTATWSFQSLGQMPSQSELSGNADGELWAFLPLEVPAELTRLDKTDGARLETFQLRGFPSPLTIDAFAFATWGGEFWLFVREFGMGNSTDVYRVDASGRLTLEVQGSGMDIVGAGVSTCAPAE